jgi:poly(3-hydroxybutyrate) depolymerase
MNSNRVLGWVATAMLTMCSALAACSDDDPASAGTPGSGGVAGSAAQGGSANAATNTGGAVPSVGGTSAGGTAGSSAGSGGTAGLAGSAGAAGSSGGAGEPVPTSGCGTAANQPLEQWNEGTLDVDGTERRWWVRLPANYDPQRAYPVVFLFHGCGTETNNVPMQNVIGDDAILVRGVATGECWDLATNGPDVAFFDAMVAAVSERHCADSSRLFGAGYSSGSWLLNLLECVRGDVLRAVGSVAGGAIPRSNCVGTVARIFVHDRDDMDNDISGSETERDRLLELNGCDTTQPPLPEEPAPCARYQGCDPENPVIWCETSGQGHSRQDGLAAEAFWGLFTEL